MQRMSLRRGTLFVIVLGLLLATGTTRQVHAIVAGSDVRGMYHGFFQSLSVAGRWGYLTFDITEIRNRRWDGAVTMIIPTGASPIELPFAVVGTISASGEFSGKGDSPAGTVNFHGQIMLIQGGAAIADGTYRFCPAGSPDLPPGPCDQGTSTLLRNFIGDPNIMPPNLNGRWDGSFASFGRGGQGTFMLDVHQCGAFIGEITGDVAPELSPNFIGTEIIDGNENNPFFFLGNIGSDNMFAVIGWNAMGDHFVVTGDYTPPNPIMPTASAEGLYALTMANGMTDRGRLFDWTQTRQLPPDPCQPVGVTGGH